MLSFGLLATAVDGTPWILVVTTGLTALGVILGAAITPLGDLLTRKDQLKGYKRNIYRNFLDHGYWCLHGGFEGETLRAREEQYIADWHRIRLITDDREVLRLIGDIREPKNFSDKHSKELLAVFSKEIGSGGIK